MLCPGLRTGAQLLTSLSSGSTPHVGLPGSRQLHEIGCATLFSHQKHVWHQGQGARFPQGIRGACSPLPWQKMLFQEQLQAQAPRAEFNAAKSTAVPGWLMPSIPRYSQRIKGLSAASSMQQVWILPYHTKFSQESCPEFVCVDWSRVLTAC